MNCKMHQRREANFLCNSCRHPICEECLHTLGGICIFCAKDIVANIKKNFVKTIIWSISLGIFGFFFGFQVALEFCSDFENETFGMFVITAIITIQMIFAPYGWNSLSRITSNFFLILPFGGWIIYFFIKCGLSFLIGWLVVIPRLIMTTKNLKYAHSLKLRIEAISTPW